MPSHPFSQGILLYEVFVDHAYLQFFSHHQTNKMSTDIASQFLRNTFSLHSHGFPSPHFSLLLKNLLHPVGASDFSPGGPTLMFLLPPELFQPPRTTILCLSFLSMCSPRSFRARPCSVHMSPVLSTTCICLLLLRATCLSSECKKVNE